MKLRLPFSSKMYDAFYNYLVLDWDYPVEDALYVTNFISSHPKIFRVDKASPLRKHLNKFNKYAIYNLLPDGPTRLNPEDLFKFIMYDCLPF